MDKIELDFDLVPETSWGKNFRTMFPKQWESLRKKSYQKANFKCEICHTPSSVLEAHEVWHYDDSKHTQSLIDIIALCKDCHSIKHFGRTEYILTNDRPNPTELNRIIQHSLKVNKINKEEFGLFLRRSKTEWKDRSQYDWQIDNKLNEWWFK